MTQKRREKNLCPNGKEEGKALGISESRTGIRAERHLAKRGKRLKGVLESSVICGLGIPRGYEDSMEE